MVKVVEIEQALERVNGDIFQEFCNHYLYLKLNPTSITPIGSVIGKEKSKKGLPDAYFTNEWGELIFAEYTTRERLKKGQSFFDKLKSDIDNCFNSQKSGLRNEQIDRVILCFTEKIKPIERIELECLCQKYNPKCLLELNGIRDLAFAVFDFPILSSTIGVKLDSEQIYYPSDFISNYEKKGVSTPLSNRFFNRLSEIEKGLVELCDNDILLVYGGAGTGKTKFAIELAKRFSEKYGHTFLCIGNKGVPIWEDLMSFIKNDQSYLLLVDDANRLSKNYQWMLNLFERRSKGTLKIVSTVRDYAFQQVKNLTKEYKFSSIEIKAFSDSEIETILRSGDFEIHESYFINQILKIARGNPRIAIMCAKVVRVFENPSALNDVSQIYDQYFDPLFNEVELLKEPITLKALAIISFFSRIDKENRNECDFIFSSLNLSENEFWEVCYSLHEHELVDLFEQQVVKISDQIFSTYIFYKVVVLNQYLDFNFFLDRFIDYKYRLEDTIIPIANTFNYAIVESKLKPFVVDKWFKIKDSISVHERLKFLDLFWFYLPLETLNFLRKEIINQTPDSELPSIYTYEYQHNQFSSTPGIDFEILSRFRYHQPEIFKDALELLLFYGIQVPKKMPAVMYVLKERLCFSRFDHVLGYYVQHTVIDLLLEKIKNSSNKQIYENVLEGVLTKYLKNEFREGGLSGRSMTIFTFQPSHSWLLAEFRSKCFNYLLNNAAMDTVLRVINSINFFEYADDGETLRADLSSILNIINSRFNYSKFKDCFVVNKIKQQLRKLKNPFNDQISNSYQSELFYLERLLNRDKTKYEVLEWREIDKDYENQILNYCKNFDLYSYLQMFSQIDTIIKQLSEITKQEVRSTYDSAINLILGKLAESDKTLFNAVFSDTIRRFNFNLNFFYIFNRFIAFNSESYFDLFIQIQNYDPKARLIFYETLNTDNITDEHSCLFYSNMIDAIKGVKGLNFYIDLKFISKFKKLKLESLIYLEVLEVLFIKWIEEKVIIDPGEEFVERCSSFNEMPTDTIVKLYLYSYKNRLSFDHDKLIFQSILEKEPKFVTKFLDFTYENDFLQFEFEKKRFDVVWKLKNCVEIVNCVFEYFNDANGHYASTNYIAAFFPVSVDLYDYRPIKYLEAIVDKEYVNEQYIKKVFSVVCRKYPQLKIKFLSQFLKLNNDVKVFEKLEIIPSSRGYSGSYVPVLEGDKMLWHEVISLINNLPDRIQYYEHKELVLSKIQYCERRIKYELKREFYEDF